MLTERDRCVVTLACGLRSHRSAGPLQVEFVRQVFAQRASTEHVMRQALRQTGRAMPPCSIKASHCQATLQQSPNAETVTLQVHSACNQALPGTHTAATLADRLLLALSWRLISGTVTASFAPGSCHHARSSQEQGSLPLTFQQPPPNDQHSTARPTTVAEPWKCSLIGQICWHDVHMAYDHMLMTAAQHQGHMIRLPSACRQGPSNTRQCC